MECTSEFQTGALTGPRPSVAAANALAHATGRRLRDLPFSPERVQTALG